MKKLFAVLLSLVIALTAVFPAFAVSEDEWNEYWKTAEAQSGVTVFPGSDETERNISWYSEKESTPRVELTDSTGTTKTFEGKAIRTYEGEYANKVTVTGLEKGKEYSYKCISEGYTSETYTIETAADNSFSALYVTDVHISYDTENEDSIRNQAYMFNSVIEQAETKSDISLILSAGDQASLGREDEYKGYTSPKIERSLSVATAPGNHDRKGVAYKYFKNMPNEQTFNLNGSYITGDYWFVKGDVLFMVMESNNGSAVDHHMFMKKAVAANKDVKWRVVMMHHDLYSGRITHRESENSLLRTIWAPLFSEMQVDLVLLGHSHYYTVSKVMNNNRIMADTGANAVVENAPGTVCMVSGSINRPRNDKSEDLGIRDTCGYYYAGQEDQVLYNVIDFSEDSIKVNSYSYTNNELFNTLTLKKDSQKGGHPSSVPAAIYGPFLYVLGTIYQFFNNIGVYNNLKDSGYDVSLIDTVFKFVK